MTTSNNAEIATKECPCFSGWVNVEVADGDDHQGTVGRCSACDYWSRAHGTAPGIPKQFERTKFTDLTPTKINREVLTRAAEWIDDHHPDFYLHGATGRGKTMIAVAMLNSVHAARDGRRCLFARMGEALPGLLLHEDEWRLKLARPDVLVLDDVGSQQGSPYARRTMQEVYDGRINTGVRTIFTSNLTLGDLKDFLEDDRLSSRIAGQAIVVRLDGPDWRIKAGLERRHT